MEILLVYVIVGICTAPWVLRGEKRMDGIEFEDVWDVTGSYALLIALWPAAVIAFPYGWRKARLAREKREAAEYEALLESVRQEMRNQTQKEFAEFDKELGIEPEWKKAHPGAANEYEYIGKSQGGRPLRIPVVERIDEVQFRVKDIAPTSWDDEQLARIEYAKRLGKMIFNRDLPNYSKGGRV